ncbi:nuclease-related domain-containing protein [Paenibacillus sp. JX-17]|uniref:Nuclease-related domain-containing protein n=1 Tax=Paenibacillus lacisoli TaxID=3064525 RepID=A0ABT9CEA9_9BACL|nr:nuclease-related domain-containing protein [Paenibacillus sp. JX-17]MDO7907582.1 nuclease-related domain-containing protein [Paenibacillus sp. JX-17]
MIKKLLSFFQQKPAPKPPQKSGKSQNAKSKSTKPRPKVESTRIGELGEHKINIQLDQLPKECKSLSDLMLPNPKSRTGYSQVDHLVISPYCLFVIETKNYNGEIKGGRSDQQWTVSNRFKMYNPLRQNYGHIKAIESLIEGVPALRSVSMISFTMRCRFSIDPELRKIQSDELIVYDVELSEFISRKLLRLKTENPEPLFSDEQIQNIYDQLSRANIADPEVRKLHVEKITSNKKSMSNS